MPRNYNLVTSVEQFATWTERLTAEPALLGFDIETGYDGEPRDSVALHPYDDASKVVGFSFSADPGWARYVPLTHDNGDNLDPYAIAPLLWKLLTESRLVIHNRPFEQSFMEKFFRTHLPPGHPAGQVGFLIPDAGPDQHDTMIEAYLLADYRYAGLKPLTKEVLGVDQAELISLFPGLPDNKKKTLRFNTLELTPEVINYACDDAALALELHSVFHERVKNHPLLMVEYMIQPIVREMERFGVQYNWAAMASDAVKVNDFKDKLRNEIMVELTAMVGDEVDINLGSTQQIAHVLYDQLGMEAIKRSKKTGNPSTDALALAGLAKRHPVVQKIVTWKELKRLAGTYLEKYERAFQYAPDGRTHPSHLQARVGSGRFAVADPPYQQCLSGDVSVLTPDGWVRLDRLGLHGYTAQVAQFNEDRIEFVTGEVVNTRCHTDMVEIGPADELIGTTSGRKGEFGTWRYTPDHRMFYRRRQRAGLGPLVETVASQWEADLNARPLSAQGRRLFDRMIPKAGHRVGGRQLTEDERLELRVAIACQADGNLRHDGSGGSSWFDVELYDGRKRDAMYAMLGGGKPQARGSERWRVQTSVWLDETKNFQEAQVLALSEPDLQWFLQEVMCWDGDFTRGNTYGQKTSRRRSVELVQAVAALCGMSTSIYERAQYDAVSVNISARQYRNAGWQQARRVPSPDGRAYCVTVPSGMLLVRNAEGYVQVTGNTPKTYHEELVDGTTMDVNFRSYIVAPPDHYQLGFDFSQVEVRVMAGLSKEPTLLRAFEEGTDLHTFTAAMMFGIPVEQVTKDLRGKGKTLNLGLLYGLSPYSLATRLTVSKEEGQRLYDLYFSAFTSIRTWMEQVTAAGKRNGHVYTPFGRKITIWELREYSNRNILEKGERMCVNQPVQGGAADYMKIAMIRADKAIKRAGLADRVHAALNIHDALEYYCHRSVDPLEVIRLINPEVTFSMPFLAKIVADWHYGQNWGNLTELEIRGELVYLKGTDTVWDGVVESPAATADSEVFELDPELLVDELAMDAEDPELPFEDDNPQPVLPFPEQVVKRWRVAMAEAPTFEQFSQAQALLGTQLDYGDLLVLTLPEGELEMPGRYAVTKAVRHQLTLLLGASVTLDPASVSGAELFAGIDVGQLQG